ncbi:MAG TPA: hypothetical protein VHV57_16965 [Acidimicrobiales bacterium]|nr:hypothetical protein [Acidimicrobiales bacterium]
MERATTRMFMESGHGTIGESGDTQRASEFTDLKGGEAFEVDATGAVTPTHHRTPSVSQSAQLGGASRDNAQDTISLHSTKCEEKSLGRLHVDPMEILNHDHNQLMVHLQIAHRNEELGPHGQRIEIGRFDGRQKWEALGCLCSGTVNKLIDDAERQQHLGFIGAGAHHDALIQVIEVIEVIEKVADER